MTTNTGEKDASRSGGRRVLLGPGGADRRRGVGAADWGRRRAVAGRAAVDLPADGVHAAVACGGLLPGQTGDPGWASEPISRAGVRGGGGPRTAGKLLEALRAEPLTREVYWLRLFTAHRDGQLQTNKVLLDSEQWPGGKTVVANSEAPLPDGMVAVRIFGLLVPDNDAAAF